MGNNAGPVKAYAGAQPARAIGSAKLSQQSTQHDGVSTNPSSQAAHNHMSSTCDAAGFTTQKSGAKNSLLRMSGGLEPIKEAKQLKSGQIVELGKIDHAKAQQKLAKITAASSANQDLIRSLPSFAPRTKEGFNKRGSSVDHGEGGRTNMVKTRQSTDRAPAYQQKQESGESALIKKRRMYSQQARVILKQAPNQSEKQSARRITDLPTETHGTAKKNTFRARSKVIDLTEDKPAKKSKQNQGPKKPSKYMQEIIRLNFVDLVRKCKLKQTTERVKAVIKTKNELRRRFLKVYRLFRQHKYGEELPEDEEVCHVPPEFQMPEELEFNNKLINTQLQEIEQYLARKLGQVGQPDDISDLHTVHEESDDEG